MLSFVNDYCENAHEAILQRLLQTNLVKKPGYGQDSDCAAAQEKIRAACACPGADVRFLVGGTQTNATVIDAVLRRYEGVIAAVSGHIAGHEAGAVEFTGHKVLTLPQHEGKLSADDLRAYMAAFRAEPSWDHMVQPGMAYISHPTEYGTLYSLAELEALAAACRDNGLKLFLDGARLGYGLVSDGTDVTLPDIARLCDVFYIGGTKVGALCGEAVVFPHGAPDLFLTTVKQHGALLAKGWLLGLQFDTLFTDGLYLRISRNAIDTANRIRSLLRQRGLPLWIDTPTNQIFVTLENSQLARLQEQVQLGIWEPVDATHTAVRLVTSWATRMDDVEQLGQLLSAL